jgi:hypothetical protein
MPSPVATTLIGFGAVLTSVSSVAGSAVAGLGLMLQGFLFLKAGR